MSEGSNKVVETLQWMLPKKQSSTPDIIKGTSNVSTKARW
jgi:hypothetical protein